MFTGGVARKRLRVTENLSREHPCSRERERVEDRTVSRIPPSTRSRSRLHFKTLRRFSRHSHLHVMSSLPEKMGSIVLPWEKLAPNTPTKTGFRRHVFEAPTPTLDLFHLHVTKLNPCENTGPLHRHPQEELVI